jgi:hypothetical protein
MIRGRTTDQWRRQAKKSSGQSKTPWDKRLIATSTSPNVGIFVGIVAYPANLTIIKTVG